MSRWLYNDSTITTEYDDHGGQLTSTSVVTYDNITHQQPTKSESFDSKGTSISTHTIYPTDSYTYNDGTANTAKASLESLHMYAMPLDIKNYRGTTLLKETENNYSNALLSVPVLSKVYEAVASNPKILQTEFTQYGAGGTLLDAKLKGTDKIAYIWGYNKSLPVAEVINATNNEIFFESFEEPGTWDNLSALDIAKSNTGKYSARIDNPGPGEYFCHSVKWLNISLNAPTKFKYSAWVYSDGPNVEVFLFMKRTGETGYYSYVDAVSTSVTGKWVYIEKEFTVPADVTQLNIRIDNNSAGTVWFDNLRLHPSASRMTTYTYEPLIGMTSVSDINNRASYYEYDEMRRLKLIRDQDRNIIKRICYNFTGQPEGCTVVPNWQWTGSIRCKPCPSNSSYFMNMRQNEEKDLNPESPTYNQLRWTDAGTSSSCVPVADWQNTATAIRCKTISGDNNGEQEREQKDMNPCSATYNQLRWIVIGTNLTSCPIPCNTSNCWGDNKKCVGGICETVSYTINRP